VPLACGSGLLAMTTRSQADLASNGTSGCAARPCPLQDAPLTTSPLRVRRRAWRPVPLRTLQCAKGGFPEEGKVPGLESRPSTWERSLGSGLHSTPVTLGRGILFRHPREGGGPGSVVLWMPAYAGMTASFGGNAEVSPACAQGVELKPVAQRLFACLAWLRPFGRAMGASPLQDAKRYPRQGRGHRNGAWKPARGSKRS